MDFIQDVLKKAKEEGKIDPELLPWDASISDISEDEVTKIEEKIEHKSQPQLLQFPAELCNDVQRIIENIRFVAKEKGLQVIGIVSAVPNEGTSTVAALISLMTAGNQNGYIEPQPSPDQTKNTSKERSEDQKRGVLLIDAQLRHPSLHKMFGKSLKPGLIELLSDGNLLNSVLQELSNFDLKLLVAGDEVRIPLTQIDSEKFKSLLDAVRGQFQFVFLDIPPLLHYAEGIALSQLCDGVVLVVRAGQTRWEVVEEAKRLLDKSEVNVLGGVLNRREFYIPEGIYRRL